MTSTWLIVIPLAGAVVAAIWPHERTRPWLLPALPGSSIPRWLSGSSSILRWSRRTPGSASIRSRGRCCPAVSLLFLACAAYAVSYLGIRTERPNRVFVVSLLAVLGLLSAGHQARHLVVLWITTEAVTLATVPLLHFNGTSRAFEATWKYLLIGGTGIALSLLGSFCLGYASLRGGGTGDLTLTALLAQGVALSRPWVLIAWVLLLVGYGTKMGLAPMHTWKPDAYGEAPGIVGALLAGGVTTVAFTAVLRVRAVVAAAGAGAIADRTLLVIGLFSMLVAALFLLGTRDFKRMLAYSSVEQMGILVIGASFGGAGAWAALFHIWSNGLTKGALFLSAGNIRRAAGARTVDEVSGMAAITPKSAAIFVTGMFAVTACPPFAPFFSELRVVRAALETGHRTAIAIFFVCLLFAFFGLSRLVFAIVDGRPRPAARSGAKSLRETAGVILPPVVLLGLSVVAGAGDTRGAARCLGGGGRPALSPAMSTSSPFALLANATSIAWADLPEWPVAELVRTTAAELDRGARLCAWFGVPDGEATRLVALIAFDADNTLAVARSAPASGGYPALTATHAQAHLFEREVWEQHGLKPEGHPWLKPVRTSGGSAPAMGEFFRVEGREVHEVAVGPVHAGIIEPGHFRFQCAGEEVLHLEIALGYQHRGVERALTGGPHRATRHQIEAVSGDATIAHATAHASVCEALAGGEAPLRAQWLRLIALELERLANHTGDLGALANDVAFLPTAAACGKIRGDFLNLTALICGNRFGRGLVRPGGCGYDVGTGATRASDRPIAERLVRG